MAAQHPPLVPEVAEKHTNLIDAVPRAGQTINHEGIEYTTIKEGLAYILVPHGTPTSTDPKMSKEDSQKQQVFYNPIQQFNRDLSVLAIKAFGQDAILRKTQKHEQQKKKAERKKKKAEGAKADKEQPLFASDDMFSRKRKLDEAEHGAPEPAGDLGKRRKSVHGGEDPLMAETDQAAMEANGPVDIPSTSGERPAWRPLFTILDALSATGLRALRYAKEIPFATSITANDMSDKATASISLNVKHNKLEDTIRVQTGNAIAHMYSFVDKKGYDVIDLDPYGTAAPFMDSAIQAINDDGLLCVTCTDSAIFASHGYLEKTYSLYGGLPFIGEACHEGGIRLILHALASSAGRYGMAIEPLLSLSIDYYIRIFVRVRKAPNDVKLLAGKTMIVYHCDNGCGAWTTQYLARNKPQANRNGDRFYKHSFALGPSADERCEHCGFKTHLSGPMYGGPLHNVGFIKRALAQLKEADRQTYPTVDRIEGMLHTALEEITFGAKDKHSEKLQQAEQLDALIPKSDPAEVDHHPFFFIPSAVSKVVHCSAPPAAAIRGALRHAGFRVTMSHCKPGSIKTDASWKDIWHIMLEWVRQRAPLKNPLKKESAGYAIMSKGSAHQPKAAQNKDAASTLENSEARAKDAEVNGGTEEQETSKRGEEGHGDRPSYMGVDFAVNFDEKLGRDHDRGKFVRYQLAPRENWGPMSRAK